MNAKLQRVIAKWLCLATLAAVALPASAAESRIAVVDLRKVFEDYFKTKAANAKLKEQLADLEKEQKALVDQYSKAKEDYKRAVDDANDQTLSAEERERRKKTAEAKLLDAQTFQQTIEDFNKTARTRLDEQERNLRERIMGEIKVVITAKAKAAGYSLVLDIAAETINRTPAIPYSSGENDITAIVLSELNAAAPRAQLPGETKK